MIVVWKEEVLALARRSRRAERTEVHMYMCITQGRAGGSLRTHAQATAKCPDCELVTQRPWLRDWMQEWLIVIMDDIRNHDCNHECVPDAYVCSCGCGLRGRPLALR